MKKIHIILLLGALSFISCLGDFGDPGGEPNYEGFLVGLYNPSEISYNNGELVIGSFDNQGNFIATDSIILNDIKGGRSFENYFVNENRWKPDLNRIRAIPSDTCYFKLKLSNGREEIIKKNVFGEGQMALRLPTNKDNFRGAFGSLGIYIENEFVYGGAQERY